MTHCRVNDNWTNEDPKAVGKHFAKGGKQQQKTCPLKVFNKMPIKKQEKIFSHKNMQSWHQETCANLSSGDLNDKTYYRSFSGRSEITPGRSSRRNKKHQKWQILE